MSNSSSIIRVKTISEMHKNLGLDSPQHPLVSVLPIDERLANFDYGDHTYTLDFYQVAMKSNIKGHITYGRNSYDFQEGSMVFTQPGQTQKFERNEDITSARGWVLFFHPDLIRRSELGKTIGGYSFFSYDVHEALHLSEGERTILTDLVEKIKEEYHQNIDKHTQKLIVNNISLILDYCMRYYDRQFYVRTNLNQDTIGKFEHILQGYYENEQADALGLPTVQWCGKELGMSPGYLSDLLKKETGVNAQQHIQYFIVEEAKNRLLGSQAQVGQIGYDLGFEYPQHFSKFFKNKTGMTPAQYRKVS
ncbi:helix-turn-helix domain-containing protein [Marinibactrum halimedae]|uniref:AraC family transcriptional regulator n=1 Tax=Marinibactrum halimedae TaxID=1444977 RepID=A0AA37T6P8_9GAMM|nr:helix-turn-helix domain-containing protein [Marinibactrum halimedae]MCD9459041.1 helix-turn-helix domain-containing protein [Marinibactrum halimedae]GLS26829.1 AraC family transcriptional regulator [Marinibactrum halimedae]